MTDETRAKMTGDTGEIWPPTPQGQTRPTLPRLSWWANMFSVPDGAATSHDVMKWWEARRLTYNLLVFGLGVPSFLLYLFFLLNSGQLPPGEDAVEPMLLFTAPVFVPLVVNICYTFGSIAEIAWRTISRNQTRQSGLLLMRLGIGFTLFVILAPSVAWGFAWFQHVVLRR